MISAGLAQLRTAAGREDVACGPGPDGDTWVPACGQQDPAPLRLPALSRGAQRPRAGKPRPSRLGARKPARVSERPLASLTVVRAPEPSGQVALIVTGPFTQMPASERPSHHANTDAGYGPVLSKLTVWQRRAHQWAVTHGTAGAVTQRGRPGCCGLTPEGRVWGCAKGIPISSSTEGVRWNKPRRGRRK